MKPFPCVFLLVFATTLAAGASPKRAELTAVFTQVQGNVVVTESAPPTRGRPEALPARHAQFLQIVKSGDRLNLPAGAGAVLFCSSDRQIELAGGTELLLTDDLCRQGKPLPPRSYERLAPTAGRMRSLAGAFVLEQETRGDESEGFAVPVVLSPRNTKIREARPTIQWTRVSEATDYEIEITGPRPVRLRFDASEVNCTETWGEVTICSLPYPTQAADIPSGAFSFSSPSGLAVALRPRFGRRPDPAVSRGCHRTRRRVFDSSWGLCKA